MKEIKLSPNQKQAEVVELLLRQKGAPASCCVISPFPLLDAYRMPLRDALENIVGSGNGTVISCIPGLLAYFEGEGESAGYIFEC